MKTNNFKKEEEFKFYTLKEAGTKQLQLTVEASGTVEAISSIEIKSKAIAKAKEGVEFPTLRLKSMGAPKRCTNNTELIRIAEDFDLTAEDVLHIASIPLKKLADEIGKTAPDGEKGQKSKDFLDAVEEASIVEKTKMRFTLS